MNQQRPVQQRPGQQRPQPRQQQPQKIYKRRPDLDISELIDLCSVPLSKEDRIKALRQYSATYPELKWFLIVAYFYTDVFKSINADIPLQYVPSTVVAKGASLESVRSMWKQIMLIFDTELSGVRIRRSKAQQLLNRLYKDDAVIVHALLTGKYKNKALNETVVAEAFPSEIPNPN